MSTSKGQRERQDRIEQPKPGEGDGGTGLSETRAETDRLFAVAARSFEAMSQGDSREFLRRSRQTGGQ